MNLLTKETEVEFPLTLWAEKDRNHCLQTRNTQCAGPQKCVKDSQLSALLKKYLVKKKTLYEKC